MSLIQGLQSLFAPRPTSQPGLKPFLPVADTSGADLRRARTRLLTFYARLEELAELTGIRTRFKLDLPDARSTSGLGLDLTNSAATLNSTNEINTTPTSFSPFGPDWSGTSTALLTVGGIYDGSQLTDTLTFEARNTGTRGADNLRIRVEDSLGNRVNVTVNRNDPISEQYSLGNGLYFTLGAGDLVQSETTSVQVFDTLGSVVDTSNPLNGIRNNDPNLEPGVSAIQNGSFTVNGETISVAPSDSINDILNRINLSNAGVTATFNAGNETVDFVQNTFGSVPTIDLAGDTSNLLEALKLDAATVTPGTDKETDIALQNVAEFSAVQTGDIVINGEAIAIDTSTDSLADVLDRISNSSAGVTASFDEATQRVTIEADDSATELTINSNGTAFFGALNIPEGQVDAVVKSGGISKRRSYDIADAAEAAFAALNELFRDSTFDNGDRYVGSIRSQLEAAIRKAFDGGTSGDLFGLRFDGNAGAKLRGEYAELDRRSFTKALQFRGRDVQDVLANRDGESGLVFDLLNATTLALTSVNKSLGISGTFVDTFA